MTRLILEIKNKRDLAILVSFLKLLDVQVLQKEVTQVDEKSDLAAFYQKYSLDTSNFRFNREEAHER